mmetsp:Transcript_3886/g.11968  ORF Transcript_3886/g.11968 Transcript_3886/m.11968 type:complete len:239 (-) Transcript_3886:195-911(-)
MARSSTNAPRATFTTIPGTLFSPNFNCSIKWSLTIFLFSRVHVHATTTTLFPSLGNLPTKSTFEIPPSNVSSSNPLSSSSSSSSSLSSSLFPSPPFFRLTSANILHPKPRFIILAWAFATLPKPMKSTCAPNKESPIGAPRVLRSTDVRHSFALFSAASVKNTPISAVDCAFGVLSDRMRPTFTSRLVAASIETPSNPTPNWSTSFSFPPPPPPPPFLSPSKTSSSTRVISGTATSYR